MSGGDETTEIGIGALAGRRACGPWSFVSRDTEELFKGGSPRKFRSFQAQAERKLQMLDTAKDLNDLRALLGNRSEKVSGGRRGQHPNQ
jgi:plasmid maintenance system killer protein